MALNQSSAPSSGVFGAIKGALDIFSRINKAEGTSENNNPLPIDEYESKLPDSEILDLVSQWNKTWRQYNSDVEPSQQLSFEYWIGKQRTDEFQEMTGLQLVDNKIFSALETFIPIATRANPDPLVQCDPSDAGQQLAHDVKQALVYEADRQHFRKLLKGVLRHWAIYRLGVLKVSYDLELKKIVTEVINPKRMMFDKDGHWDESCYFTGEYIGEKKRKTAKKLIAMFPKQKEYILGKANNKLGTKLEYWEFWYQGTDVFYVMDMEVLGKFKNPHWNYDMPVKDAKVDEDGNELEPAQEGTPGVNHQDKPMFPYRGLSVFTTGLQPHDETSLILQNIGLQDMVNRRYRQLDKNIEGMNNGMVVSSDFTAEQASQASSALRKGGAIRSASQDVTKSVMRLPAPALPDQVFEMMRDGRSELADIFGTSGSTPQGQEEQDTVRGKILTSQLDSSRIGGGVTEFLEQLADAIYNTWVQFMFVHWTEPQYIVAAGQTGAQDIIELQNTDFLTVQSLDITVKEGSLIPKDPLTERNQAIDLWSANAIDPISFYRALDLPDPQGAAEQLMIWQMVQKGQLPPTAYIPTFMQDQGGAPQPQQPGLPTTQPGTGGPAVSPPTAPAENPAPAPASGGAVEEQSKQLLQSVKP